MALALLADGRSLNSVSKQLGVSRSTLRDWRARPEAALQRSPTTCHRCCAEPTLPPEQPYAHLLGLYLGDGCVSLLKRGVYSLRIACCDAYPALIDECAESIGAVRPGPVSLVASQGCTYVVKYWKHWPCLFPQHGPGRKHERRIFLQPWQQQIVERHTGPFLRGLFHSDGCRVENWTVRQVAGNPKRYTYPRYFFNNRSGDIMEICQWALGLLRIGWTMPTPNALSVARKADVAVLDQHVGPKR